MNHASSVEIFARHRCHRCHRWQRWQRWQRWLGLIVLIATIWIANTILWLHVGYIAELPDARFLILGAAGHLVAGWLAGRVGLHFRWLALAFRIPGWLTGHAEVEESYDEGSDRFRTEVRVGNPLFGLPVGYRGRFRLEWVDAMADPPSSILPRRLEVIARGRIPGSQV